MLRPYSRATIRPPPALIGGRLFQRPVDNSQFIYKTLICKGEPYDWKWNQARHSRTGDPQRSRGRAISRLRNGAPHRAANQGRAALHAGCALSHAVPHGAAGLDSRRLGNQPGRAPQALLPPHSFWEEKVIAATQGMGRTLWCAEEADQGGACLIGKSLTASVSPTWPLMLRRRMKSKWNSRHTWKNRTKYFAKKDYLIKTRLHKPLSDFRSCGNYIAMFGSPKRADTLFRNG